MFARIDRQQRVQQKTEHRHNHEEQQQRESGALGSDPQTLIEPFGLHQLAEQPQKPQAHGKGHRDAFHHVVMFEMAELMR